MNIDWEDWGSTFVAAFFVTYPNVTGEAVAASLADGTWLAKLMTVVIAVFMIRHKGRRA